MSQWIVKWGPERVEPELRLFCFPYAGGGAAAFRLWPRLLPEWVEVCAIQPPGRGNRIRERPMSDLMGLVEAAGCEMSNLLDRPFAVFGHSMGAIVASEVCRKLEQSGGPVPLQLFVSARRPPRIPDPNPPLRQLSDADFIAEVNRRYDAVPAEIMAEPDVLALLLPGLRADIEALETHRSPDAAPMRTPIMALGGESDFLTPRSHLTAWRDETSGSWELRLFPGGHFYIDSMRREVVQEISRVLRRRFDDLSQEMLS